MSDALPCTDAFDTRMFAVSQHGEQEDLDKATAMFRQGIGRLALHTL